MPSEARRRPLAPELQIIVNCCVVVGTKPRSSGSGASALNYWAISLAQTTPSRYCLNDIRASFLRTLCPLMIWSLSVCLSAPTWVRIRFQQEFWRETARNIAGPPFPHACSHGTRLSSHGTIISVCGLRSTAFTSFLIKMSPTQAPLQLLWKNANAI